MEKNRIRPVEAGNNTRMSFSKQKEVLQMPNLIEVQKNSYEWFLKEGLNEVFKDISPISDYNGHLSLEFVGYKLCRDDVKYTIEECKERDGVRTHIEAGFQVVGVANHSQHFETPVVQAEQDAETVVVDAGLLCAVHRG